jgi:hypothetical protein
VPLHAMQWFYNNATTAAWLPFDSVWAESRSEDGCVDHREFMVYDGQHHTVAARIECCGRYGLRKDGEPILVIAGFHCKRQRDSNKEGPSIMRGIGDYNGRCGRLCRIQAGFICIYIYVFIYMYV